ncbi:MAG TPA: hypothetical protein VGG38_14040 [Acidimicrobiales bacterium]|jgi:hypothetical protein
MSRWEIELRYDRQLKESDDRYLALIREIHPQVGYLRHRDQNGCLVVTVETHADNRQNAVEQAMIQSMQLWIHCQPFKADVVSSPEA